jgi:hypothetical protein
MSARPNVNFVIQRIHADFSGAASTSDPQDMISKG